MKKLFVRLLLFIFFIGCSIISIYYELNVESKVPLNDVCGNTKSMDLTTRYICSLPSICDIHLKKDKNKVVDYSTWSNLYNVTNLSLDYYKKYIKGNDVKYPTKNSNKKLERSGNILLVVFSTIDLLSLTIIKNNIKLLNRNVYWLIFLFGDKNDLNMQHFYSHHDSTRIHIISSKYDGYFSKPGLFRQILPYASKYEWIWLLDSDISFENFDIIRLKNTLQATKKITNGPTPLILQPLCKNLHPYDYRKFSVQEFWQDKEHNAAYVDFIEQGYAILNAEYFEWLVVNIVSPFEPLLNVLSVDWGFDVHWCKIALQYHILTSDTVFNDTYPCAIVTSVMINHKDTKTIRTTSSDLGKSRLGNWRHCMKGSIMINLVHDYINLKSMTNLKNFVAMNI